MVFLNKKTTQIFQSFKIFIYQPNRKVFNTLSSSFSYFQHSISRMRNGASGQYRSTKYLKRVPCRSNSAKSRRRPKLRTPIKTSSQIRTLNFLFAFVCALNNRKKMLAWQLKRKNSADGIIFIAAIKIHCCSAMNFTFR